PDVKGVDLPAPVPMTENQLLEPENRSLAEKKEPSRPPEAVSQIVPTSDVAQVKKPMPVMKKKLIEPKASQPVMKQEPLLLPQEKPRIVPDPALAPVSVVPPAADLPDVQKPDSPAVEPAMPDHVQTITEDPVGVANISKNIAEKGIDVYKTGEAEKRTDMAGGAIGGREAADRRYVNDHFAYIRNKILRNVTYPDAARRMGWQGRVILSFIIMADGSVRALEVVQSSGFAMLDRNAVEAVHDTAPFPRPPCEARLVIPVSYQLK
ncbi:MAG TPA: TonB family protein, partial [Syntrophales bacterium]|nr:TonB family protein [Syntrophales bacterium]